MPLVHASTQSMHREPSKHHLLPLDGLRGFAVLAVLVYHLGGGAQSSFLPLRILAFINLAGWSGVTLFFVLSGFLITGILWDSRGEPHWWRNFYARRALRIFPLYYAALILVLIAAAFTGTLHAAAAKIWVPALFLQDLPGPDHAILFTASPLHLYHFWSLAVEEHFYLVWPALLLLLKDRRQGMRLCTLVFVLSALLRIVLCVFAADPGRYDTFLLSRIGEMAAGSWLAFAYRDALWARIQHPARWFAPASLAVYSVVSLWSGTAKLESPLQFTVGLPAITVFYASLLVVSLQNGVIQRFTTMRWLRWIGSISYGIYVFHILLTEPFNRLAAVAVRGHAGNAYLAARFFITLFGSIAVAWLSFNIFERPFLKLKSRFSTHHS